MKRFAKSILGVTLLEIMLVLAVAAMIIVMSVRYYQSASASQQANATVQQLQAITAAADSLAQGSGSYMAPTAVSNTTLSPLLPNGTYAFTTPWGGTITVTAVSASTYTVSVSQVPANVCALVVLKLSTNSHYANLAPANPGACPATAGDITYTYTANP